MGRFKVDRVTSSSLSERRRVSSPVCEGGRVRGMSDFYDSSIAVGGAGRSVRGRATSV